MKEDFLMEPGRYLREDIHWSVKVDALRRYLAAGARPGALKARHPARVTIEGKGEFETDVDSSWRFIYFVYSHLQSITVDGCQIDCRTGDLQPSTVNYCYLQSITVDGCQIDCRTGDLQPSTVNYSRWLPN
jgi:hypothetical protein